MLGYLFRLLFWWFKRSIDFKLKVKSFLNDVNFTGLLKVSEVYTLPQPLAGSEPWGCQTFDFCWLSQVIRWNCLELSRRTAAVCLTVVQTEVILRENIKERKKQNKKQDEADFVTYISGKGHSANLTDFLCLSSAVWSAWWSSCIQTVVKRPSIQLKIT